VRQFRPEVPLVIDQLVDRMLARDANDRPATAGDVSRIFSAAVAIPAAADGQAAPPLRADLAADTAAIVRPALEVTVPDIFDPNPLLLDRLGPWRRLGGHRCASRSHPSTRNRRLARTHRHRKAGRARD
jgi:hypothetical protein